MAVISFSTGMGHVVGNGEPVRMAAKAGSSARLILVVDDEEHIRLVAAAAIESFGYRALLAADAHEALKMLESHPDIDLVFTDVRMPGEMDGAELAFTIRSRWPRMAIVVVSGNFDPRTSRLPIGSSFLPKPYRIPDLEALLRKHLG